MAEASADKKAPESKKTEEKPKEKAKLVAVSNEPSSESAKPKRDILNISILVVTILNVSMLITLGVFVNKMSSRVKEVQEKTATLIENANAEEKEREASKDKKKSLEAKLVGKELEAPAQGTLYPLDSFLVNIASDQGSKFLQTQLELELSEATLEEEVTKKRAALRDAIIVLLSSKSYKELKEPGGIKVLRNEVTRALNSLLNTGKIKEVYFTQFHFN
jgi:flagellar FliL protein